MTPRLAGHWPDPIRAALMSAAKERDHDRIDRLTDQLAALGVVRRRDEATNWRSVTAARLEAAGIRGADRPSLASVPTLGAYLRGGR